MVQHVDAVYENGVLRPLAPIALSESQRVRITITATDRRPDLLDVALVDRARAEVAEMKELPTIEEVRAALSAIPGSLSEDVIAERGEH
jgi:predicted DNA-binding antitoxin AbrB/MazE fold protein